MSTRGRLQRLEKRHAPKDGCCPECGFRPDDIRLIVVSAPVSDPTAPRRRLPPEMPRCGTCGGIVPPCHMMIEDTDGTLSADPLSIAP
jgi:hypothetical protein